MKLAVKLLAWLLVLFTLWRFLGDWFAPDACLDSGGSFNYELWECSGEVNQYVDVWFYELNSFKLFFVALVFACVLQWQWRRSIQQAVPADRPKTGSG
jgi:hypothetical protein